MAGFRAFEAYEAEAGRFASRIVERDTEALPPGELLVRVRYSSVNYKDALSAAGRRGVTRAYPHTPGIDAAGEVERSASAAFRPGDRVIVSGYDLGMNTPGGFGRYVRAPAAWAAPLPEGLDLRESMILGTAGLTAALCVERLRANGLESGEVLVTGASGGVGCVAVALLAMQGFSVTAATGKPEAAGLLRELGAAEVIDRAELPGPEGRPLLKPRWAGAVDVAGGGTLAGVLKSLAYGGAAAACGLVDSPSFPGSVLPFILRGVSLLGVDSAELPIAAKRAAWARLAGEWKPPGLERLVRREVGLEELDGCLRTVLAGGAAGRFLLDLDR